MLPNLSGLSLPNGVPTEAKRKRDEDELSDDDPLADAVAKYFIIKAFRELSNHLYYKNQLSTTMYFVLDSAINVAEDDLEYSKGNEQFESLYEGGKENEPDIAFRKLVNDYTSKTIALIVRSKLIFWKIKDDERDDNTEKIYNRINAIGMKLGACVVRLYHEQSEDHKGRKKQLTDAGKEIVEAGFAPDHVPFDHYRQYLDDLVEVVYGPMHD